MGLGSKMKGLRGQVTAPQVAAATNIVIPPEYDVIYMTGTDTVVKVLTDTIRADREVVFRSASGNATFQNNNDTTTLGQMDLGGTNLALQANDVLKIMQKSNGVWVASGIENN